MTPELEQAYRDSCEPFIRGGGAITEREAKMQPWRVFLEISSACNLFCPSCTKGNQKSVEGLKYEHQSGFMDPDLMERILDKIKSENPEAICFLYGNSEPWLHPRLPECITAVKKRGLGAQFSTNLNHMQRVEETLAAQPDMIIVSLSGFTQEVYEKGHAGGKIERVKANMVTLGTFNQCAKTKVNISVNYHVYRDNEHEIEPMREHATKCGLNFFTSTARAISMENTVQWLREKEGNPAYEVQDGFPDLNKILPRPSQQWRDTMARLRIPPDRAREMYAHFPVSPVCAVGAGSIFVFIRHDGKVQLCSCTADRRLTLGNYLDLSPDEMIEKRTGHAFCKQCIKYRTNLYFMICQRDLWD